MVAQTAREEVDATEWTEQEREVIVGTKWWSLDELRSTSETVYPKVLAELLPAVLRGDYPDPALTIVL